MILITPIVYLALMTWAIVQSNRRWMTLLWIVVSLVAPVGLFAGAAEIRPDLTDIFGHMALIPSLLISALVGVNHMQSNPRALSGKNTL
jgi:peptidoglycan/LPS O-acetylase OafA/YrhL